MCAAMADMEDLFGSDADSDAERKGGIRWASEEGCLEGLLRRKPKSRAVPGVQTRRHCEGAGAPPPLLPQRPLRPGGASLPGGGTRTQSVRLDVLGVHGARSSWERVEQSGLGGRSGGAGEPAQPREKRWGPALFCLAQTNAH